MKIEEEAQKIYEKILPILNGYIKEKEENKERFDADAFMHILANIIPAHIYASMEEKQSVEFDDLISFNHIANRLLFKYATMTQEPENFKYTKDINKFESEEEE